jgi:hypothetical protein
MHRLLNRSIFILQVLILTINVTWWHINSMRYRQNSNGTYFTISNTTTSDSSIYVALSVNNDVRYAYHLPFVLEGWLRCGVQPVFVLIGDEQMWRQKNCTSIVLDYLHNKSAIMRHFTNLSLINNYKSHILARTSRLAVPHILKEMGISSKAILWTGDADVIPLKCDYFKSIPHTMKKRNIQVYMDGPWDMSIPRYLMCYIAAYLSSWYNLTEEGSSIEQVMENTLHISNVKMAYNNPNRTEPEYDFDEHYLGKRIKRLSCFPNCTTHGQPRVRNYSEEKRGPGRPPFNWTEALGKNPQETLDYLGKLTEAHSGTGMFSFYGKQAWPLFRGLLKIFMERDVVNRLSVFANDFFQLNC